MKTITNEEFLKTVIFEIEAMKEYGTSYRYKTAELSLEVLKVHFDVDLYRNRQKAYEVAANVLTDSNEERLLDVAQMLNSLLVSLERKLNASEDFKVLLAEKIKGFKLVQVKESNKENNKVEKADS